jgi:hypothetical protein
MEIYAIKVINNLLGKRKGKKTIDKYQCSQLQAEHFGHSA